MKQRGLRLWRVFAALTHVGTGITMGVAVASDEVVVAVALLPLLAATLLVVAERSLGAFLLLAALVPPLALSAPGVVPPFTLISLGLGPCVDPAPLWEACLACAVGALVVVALLTPRLMRFDAPVALIAAALAVVLGVGVTALGEEPVRDLQHAYWGWQGEREAQRDWDAGRLRLKSYGMGGGYYASLEEQLQRFGVGVEQVAECVLPRKGGARWIGYNRAAERLIRARYGDRALSHRERCIFGEPTL